jgi:hypothetical protein
VKSLSLSLFIGRLTKKSIGINLHNPGRKKIMKWATKYITRLQAGETIQIRPVGKSMTGRIEKGQLVTVEPVTDPASISLNDIVLCSVNGNQFLHIVKTKRGDQFEIKNNHGRVNGWTDLIYGRVIAIE